MWVSLPNGIFDPKIGADLYAPLSRRIRHRGRARLQPDAQRASSDRDLPQCRGAAHGRHRGAADQARPHLRPRQSGRQPRRPDPGGRGDGDDRLHLARPARRRLRARRALRNICGQHQSHANGGAAVGSRRPDREGVDHPRRAVPLRGPFHASARHQCVAAPLPEPASADLDHRLERLRRHPQGREPRLHLRDLPAAARECAENVRRLPQRLSGRRAAGWRRHGLYAARLHGRHRSRSRARRAGAVLVHQRQGRAAVPQSAGLRAGRAQREGAAGRLCGAHRGDPRPGPGVPEGAGRRGLRHARFTWWRRSGASTSASAASTTC